MKSARKFGFELEYASNSNAMIRELHDNGLMLTDFAHDYHCTCQQCTYTAGGVMEEDHHCNTHCQDYGCWNEPHHNCRQRGCPRRTRPPIAASLDSVPDLRAQRDSTADGEFITRPMDDWDDLQRITQALTTAASNAGATASQRCGLHVHVDTSDDLADVDRFGQVQLIEQRLQRRRTTSAAYLAFERYFTEIVAPGASIRKRDMNNTLMEATRSYISHAYAVLNPQGWMDMGRNEVDNVLQQSIQMDRHVDLNWSQRNGTWEFRCFNATNAPWRIELACRMAVAFVEATFELREAVENVVRGSKFWPVGCDSPWGEIIRPAFSELSAPHPTKRPVVPMEQFLDILCAVDADLRPLIERQANFMRTRYAHEVVAAS